jgi:hypothetical protein
MSEDLPSGRPLQWNALQMVLHMSRLTSVVLLLMPAAFLASPLTADDLYGAPDPGWYNAGSGWSQGSAQGSGYDAPEYRPSSGGGEYGYGSDHRWSGSCQLGLRYVARVISRHRNGACSA